MGSLRGGKKRGRRGEEGEGDRGDGEGLRVQRALIIQTEYSNSCNRSILGFPMGLDAFTV